MTSYWLSLDLLSDATFGAGSGIAGLIDVEIEHDANGFPFLGGRALKGLLVEEYANIRFALGKIPDWDAAATTLFGQSGATIANTGQSQVRYGAAQLPSDLRAALLGEVRSNTLRPDQVLNLLTSIRRQTSISLDGGPDIHSLRSMRVLIRKTPLLAHLESETELSKNEQALLAACVLGLRRGGISRNRGRGRMRVLLHTHEPTTQAAFTDASTTTEWFAYFASEVQK